MYKGGFRGKILWINLSDKVYRIEELPGDIAKKFIGGAGIVIKMLYDDVPAKVDSVGPENKLIFAGGPFAGTGVPCASRIALATKSSLTSAKGMAMTGGYFPAEMKFVGYDIIKDPQAFGSVGGKAEAVTARKRPAFHPGYISIPVGG